MHCPSKIVAKSIGTLATTRSAVGGALLIYAACVVWNCSHCLSVNTLHTTMCNDVGEGSRCCAFYSVTGFIFTLWVGVMLQTQPFFIGGIEDVDLARESAFGAMGMFLVCFVLSAVGIWYDSQYKVEPSTTEPEAEYHLSNDGIATYGTST